MEDDYARSGTTSSPTTGHHEKNLMTSAKLIAEAAKAAMSKDSSNIDKAELAAASADLLGAAKRYGKLEDKALGKYLEKAEAYLNHYHASHPSDASHGGNPANHGSGSSGSGAHGYSSGGGGGYGDYIKIAQGLLKGGEHGEGAHGGDGGGGGYGEYIKMAQVLLNKDKHGKEGADGDSSTGGSGVGASDYIKMAQGLLRK